MATLQPECFVGTCSDEKDNNNFLLGCFIVLCGMMFLVKNENGSLIKTEILFPN